MRKYLRKALLVFTLGLVSSFLLSSHLTASIGEPLAEEATHQNVKRILDNHLNDNRDLLNSSKDQNIVVFLGATGAGKSTLINFLTNHPLRLNEDEELELENPTDLSAMKIGNRGVSETFLPRGLSAEGFVFYDLAGFRDTRGTAINLVNASFIKHLIENARSTRLVFVAGQDEITASRGESFKNLLRITQSLFPNSTALDQLSLLVITKSIKRTAEDLIPYLEQRLEDRQRVALWLNPSRLSPMSKGTDAVQKATILQKIRNLPPTVIRDVNIEAIYSEDVRRALTEIFVLEMTKAKDETWSSAPINPISINDIDQARVYFSGTFEGDVLSKVNGSSLFCLLKPLSERGFADEQAKLLATIKHIRDLKLSQLELQKEKLQREEERKSLKAEEERRNQEFLTISEQNRQLQQQMQQLRDDQRKAEDLRVKENKELLEKLRVVPFSDSEVNSRSFSGKYIIQSLSSKAYLDGRAQGAEIVLVTNRNPQGDHFLQWRIETVEGYYALKSVSSNSYLDGRAQHGENVLVTNRNPQGNHYLQWRIESVNGYHALKSVSSNAYIDGRAHDGDNTVVTKRTPQGDHFLQWSIRKIS